MTRYTVPALSLFGGVVSSLLWMGSSSGSIGALILGYLTPLPLFLIGLSMGIIACMIGIVSAALIIVTFIDAQTAAFYLLMVGLSTFVIVYQALLRRWTPDGNLQWYPLGGLLGLIGGLGLITLGVIWFVTRENGFYTTIEQLIQQSIIPLWSSVDPQIETKMTLLIGVFPGLLIVSWLLFLILNGIMAQALLVRFEYNRRPSVILAQMTLPTWICWLFLVTLVIALTGSGDLAYTAINALIVLCLVLFFGGIAVIHAVSTLIDYRFLVLLIFYILLFVTGWPVLVAIGLGLIEPWLALRRRLGLPPPDTEIDTDTDTQT